MGNKGLGVTWLPLPDLASHILPAPGKVWSARDSGSQVRVRVRGRSVLPGTPTSVSFSHVTLTKLLTSLVLTFWFCKVGVLLLALLP